MNGPEDIERAIAASHLAYRPYERKKLRFILSAISEYARSRGIGIKDVTALEIGCGSGGVALPAARLGCKVRAFDVDSGEVEVLIARAKELGVEVDARTADGLDYSDGRVYDIVIASEVFEHVADPPALVRNILLHMRPGSRLIVTVPNGYGPWQTLDRLSIRTRLRKSNLLRRLLGRPLYVKQPGRDHCQFYTKSRIVRLFERHGFRLLRFGRSNSVFSISPRLSANQFLGELDARLTDRLPYWMASGWYFVFELGGWKAGIIGEPCSPPALRPPSRRPVLAGPRFPETFPPETECRCA